MLTRGKWRHRGGTFKGENAYGYIWRQSWLLWAFTQWSNFFTFWRFPPSQQYYVDQTWSLWTVARHAKLHANHTVDAVKNYPSFWKQPVARMRTKWLCTCHTIAHSAMLPRAKVPELHIFNLGGIPSFSGTGNRFGKSNTCFLKPLK